MRSLSPHRPRRIAHLRRHRPRKPVLAHPSAADAVKTSDLVLAVTGVTMLGGFCLVLATNLLTF